MIQKTIPSTQGYTVEVPIILGGGIGAIPKVKGTPHLTNHALEMFNFLSEEFRQKLGIELKRNETDMFTIGGRKNIVDAWVNSGMNEDIYNTRDSFVAEHLAQCKLFVKFPGETLTNKQILEMVFGTTAVGNESDEEVIKFIANNYNISQGEANTIHGFLRRSPNDYLRDILKQTTIYRPFPSIEGAHKPMEFKEGQTQLLDIASWSSDRMENIYQEKDNIVERSLRNEEIEQYCQKLVLKAQGKTVIIPTKSTITAFEAEFLRRCKTVLDENSIEYKEILTDAFLESLAHNTYDAQHRIVASVPNVIASLEKVATIGAHDIEKNIDTYSERHFYRIATKDGYGEKYKTNENMIVEENTLETDAARQAIKDAYQKAQDLKTILTLVIDDSNNPNNKKLKAYTDEITQGNYRCITLGDYLHATITNPQTLGSVFVGSNVIGDYVSDANAGFACSTLAPGASLGIAASVDSNRNGVIEANPAAGTAPAMANDEEKSKGIVPVCILSSITQAILEIFKQDPETYDAMKKTIDTLQTQIMVTAQEYIERKEKDYSTFTQEVIQKTRLRMEQHTEELATA